jgi:hypothetical protein
MDWTSTRVPMWQSDCEQLRRLRRPFELRDVAVENERFVELYAERWELLVTKGGTTVTFSPKI